MALGSDKTSNNKDAARGCWWHGSNTKTLSCHLCPSFPRPGKPNGPRRMEAIFLFSFVTVIRHGKIVYGARHTASPHPPASGTAALGKNAAHYCTITILLKFNWSSFCHRQIHGGGEVYNFTTRKNVNNIWSTHKSSLASFYHS